MLLRKLLHIFRPDNYEQARLYKRRFALAYAFLGWHVCGLVFYILYNQHIPSDKDGRKTALLNCLAHGQDVRTIQLSGFTVVDTQVVRSNEGTVSQVPANQQ